MYLSPKFSSQNLVTSSVLLAPERIALYYHLDRFAREQGVRAASNYFQESWSLKDAVRADVFELGIALHKFFFNGAHPFPLGIMRSHSEDPFHTLDRTVPVASSFFRSLLNLIPSQRPSPAQARNHPLLLPLKTVNLLPSRKHRSFLTPMMNATPLVDSPCESPDQDIERTAATLYRLLEYCNHASLQKLVQQHMSKYPGPEWLRQSEWMLLLTKPCHDASPPSTQCQSAGVSGSGLNLGDEDTTDASNRLCLLAALRLTVPSWGQKWSASPATDRLSLGDIPT